jgi:hypothetical protein
VSNISASNFTLTDNGGAATAADITALNQALDYLNSVSTGSGLLLQVALISRAVAGVRKLSVFIRRNRH